MRFIDNHNGTVTDTQTGLMWQKVGSARELTWEEAQGYAKSCRDGGYADWRLPTVHELFGLVDVDTLEPIIDPAFQCRSDHYWSGSIYAAYPDYAWYVGFYDGFAYWNYKAYNYYVRCVREKE